jgi:FlaG/FlaF family flagellin (archaellin)
MHALRRGVSPVVGTVLSVALVAVLATGVLAAGTAIEELDEPPPAVVTDGSTLTAACVGCSSRDQVVQLRHVSGGTVEMSDVAVVVSVPAHDTRGRLVGLPLETNCLRDSHVELDDLFDGRCGRVGGALTAVGSNDDGVWRAGETLSVRLKKSTVRLDPGEEVVVEVVHTPSGSPVTTERLPAAAA